MWGKADLVYFTVRRQRRVVRSTFGAELNWLVDSIEQMLSLQIALHHIYCGTGQSPEDMIDLLENGWLYPKLDIAVDARAVYDAVASADAREPQGSSLKLHFISVRGRLTQGIIRRTNWVDTRDMLADVSTKSCIDRTLLHNASNGCTFNLAHEALSHTKRQVGSTTKRPEVAAPEQPQH